MCISKYQISFLETYKSVTNRPQEGSHLKKNIEHFIHNEQVGPYKLDCIYTLREVDFLRQNIYLASITGKKTRHIRRRHHFMIMICICAD